MIYVDELIFPKKGGKLFCHMVTDSMISELHEFAKMIGRKRGWFHKASIEHYDLDEKFRAIAIVFGARPIEYRELVKLKRREKTWTVRRS